MVYAEYKQGILRNMDFEIKDMQSLSKSRAKFR